MSEEKLKAPSHVAGLTTMGAYRVAVATTVKHEPRFSVDRTSMW
jgi:hypothetical protein